MRILTYNIFEGAKSSLQELIDFVDSQHADVVCLQEANAWGDNNCQQINDFAHAINMPYYVYGDSNTPFKLATFSLIPIISHEVHTDIFWHSAVRTTVQLGTSELDIWSVHLDPRDEDKRLAEANHLARMIGATSDVSRLALIAGDFNSLCRVDDYPPDLISQLVERGIRKFGETALRYDVMDYFAKQGFIDVADKLGLKTTTVPTPSNIDVFHAAELRLDYMLATPALMGHIQLIKTVKTPETDKISDHYPTIVSIKE